MQNATDAEFLKTVLARRFCFVGGQGKSGTTWLQLILDSHPDIVCSGEGHPADVLALQINQAFDHHRQFIEQNNRQFRELTPYHGPTDADRQFALRTAIALMLARQCTDDLPAVLADRTPANIGHLPLLNDLFPAATFIHVLRDPRDIAVSLWFHGLRTNQDWLQQRYQSIDNLAIELVSTWTQGLVSVRADAQDFATRYHEVRYEDLHERFDECVGALFDALSVETTRAQLQATRHASDFKNVTKGRATGTEDRASHFRKGAVGDWRSHLSPQTVELIKDQSGATLADVGYG